MESRIGKYETDLNFIALNKKKIFGIEFVDKHPN